MGGQNNKSKTDELSKLAKSSDPIMSASNRRACTIENGKIIVNFNNFKEEYDSLNHDLEKLKNKMNLIISNDSIELIQKKLEELHKITINEELQNSINSFSSIYKTNLKNYYDHINEIKKVYKQSYLSITTFLTNWLKEQKKVEIDGEKQNIENFEKEMGEVKNKFDKFKEVEELVNKICYFKIDYNSKDIYNEIDKYFNENKDEINKYYKIENVPQLRSFINLRDVLFDNNLQKNNFIELLVGFHKNYLSLYMKVIEGINLDKIEKVEIANEFNEFSGVIIYHRLIRSIEERIKKIKID